MGTLTDAKTGQTHEVGFDPNGDPGSKFIAPFASDLQNMGLEGSVPAWRQSRYFTEIEDWEAFQSAGVSIPEWFEDSPGFQASGDGKNWASLSTEEREMDKHRAADRIERKYESTPSGERSPQAAVRTSGKARYEAEKVLNLVEALY